jgi:peptidoglycan/xylan/chitin deacetylase (PgdA/CDA1 family)
LNAVAIHSSRFYSGAIARIAASSGLIAPCYHVVTNEIPAHIRNLYVWRDVAAFEKDLDYLLQHYRPVSLDQLHSCRTSGQPLPPRSMFLSFDDGFREMSETVAPICKQKGVPVTFFLSTAFLDNRSLCYRHKASVLIDAGRRCSPATLREASRSLAKALELTENESLDFRRLCLSVSYKQRHVFDECAPILGVDFDEYLKTVQPYLTTNQIHRLLEQGFSIGGHSVDHPKYSELALDDQLDQTARCMEELDRHFQISIRAFAFPFVSDGVGREFYDAVFGKRIADIVFCIGEMPATHRERAVQRFGVESATGCALESLLVEQVKNRLRRTAAAWRKEIAVYR